MKIVIRLCSRLFGKKDSTNHSTQPKNQEVALPKRRPEDIPKLYARRPSFLRAFKKAVNGVTALLIGYILDLTSADEAGARNNIANEIAKATGVALLFDSGQECINAFLYISNKRTVNRDQRFNSIVRKEKIAKTTINLLTTGMASYYALQELQTKLDNSISPFAFSFPAGYEGRNAGALMNYINVPVVGTAIAILLAQTFIYNGVELRLAIRSNKPRRDDPVVFKFVNGLSYISATANITRNFNLLNNSATLRFTAADLAVTSKEEIMRQVYEAQQNLKNKSLFVLPLWLINKMGRYEAYKGLVQILNNFQELVFDQVTVEIQEFTHERERPSINTRKSNTKHLKETQEIPQANHLSIQPPPALLEASSENTPEINAEEQKPKIKGPKTRGIPNPHYAQNASASLTNSNKRSEEDKENKDNKETVERENVRVEKLALISELRCYHQVNNRVIEKEMNNLSSFLPECQIQRGDGSENTLFWKWKQKAFNVKFEIVHGDNKNEYSGSKLRKVLNVLEAGYLWGWNQAKISEYLSQRKKGSGLEKLQFIFGERAKL